MNLLVYTSHTMELLDLSLFNLSFGGWAPSSVTTFVIIPAHTDLVNTLPLAAGRRIRAVRMQIVAGLWLGRAGWWRTFVGPALLSDISVIRRKLMTCFDLIWTASFWTMLHLAPRNSVRCVGLSPRSRRGPFRSLRAPLVGLSPRSRRAA